MTVDRDALLADIVALRWALLPLALSSLDHPPKDVKQRDWAEAVNAARVVLADTSRQYGETNNED